MSKYPIELKEKAVILRKRGYSIKEIAKKLRISQGTSSLWVRDIILGNKAIRRLEKRKLLGRYKTSLRWHEKRLAENKLYKDFARSIISKFSKNIDQFAIYIALIFWCEGGKRDSSSVRFTNSDPGLISLFLFLLREVFNIEESKLRVRLHLHNYHNEKKQKLFWSKIMKIPIKQFRKTYFKPHTKKRERIDYPGCVNVVYHDVQILKKLKAIYENIAKMHTGV